MAESALGETLGIHILAPTVTQLLSGIVMDTN